MSPDVDTLLQPVSADAPAGEDLENDPARLELDHLAQGKPERHMGKVTVPAEEPNWSVVESKAAQLLQRSKDLSVASQVVRAWLARRGFIGLSEGLQFLDRLLQIYWDQAYPRVEGDGTARLNAFAFLSGADTLVATIRRTPFVTSRAHGNYNLRDVYRASGKLPSAPDTPAPDPSAIEAALMTCDIHELESNAAAVRNALKCLASIEATLSERLGAVATLDVEALRTLLKEIAHQLETAQTKRVPAEPVATVESPVALARAMPASPIGALKSRDDVVHALDAICAYLYQSEPSSPVPLLLQRAKRLVSKDFMEILQDLAPEAVNQVEKISGSNKP
jgi:type VI secretion system protein ImpA